jgi:hypothetical protein
MRLTLFVAVLVAAITGVFVSGCGGATTNTVLPTDDTSNVTGMRGTANISSTLLQPRVSFAYASLNGGGWITDSSCTLPKPAGSWGEVQFKCPWPTALQTGSDNTWEILLYDDKNNDMMYQESEFVAFPNIHLRRSQTGKFEYALAIGSGGGVVCEDATKIIGSGVYIDSSN